MPDYGHPLRFGTFVTPVNSPVQRPVELALLSEELGYDLVTFQDHPYQPGFNDTWTLLTWVAAKTERIHVSGNVLNSPLRQPAVLARAAAGLDLLSGGRFEMGLGAGGFWDAIAAMGGPHWTAGQSVEALAEAIDVVRQIWDASERGGVRVPGRYYPVSGAKRGPAPAHDIPVWVGAYKPRMLRLVARAADGWLPSLPYLQPGDLQRGNAVIDEAAAAAGRDPREIVRLLNVSGRESVDELLRCALDDGVSTFIVMADEPDAMQRFATRLVPELRERVEEARAGAGTVTGRPRRAASLAKRVPGIDYDGVPDSLRARAVEPGDADYARVRSNYLRGGSPGLVLRPRGVDEVRDALAFARRHPHVPLGVRSRGHGVSGRSTNHGGIVIDLKDLDAVEVTDPGRRLVRAQPGARWLDVARALAPHGLAISSGDYGGVGVGGLATAGGIGWLAREHGLTIDHLRGADVLLADGSLVRADAAQNPDLFWAIRGAGANFGIVTAFDFEAAPVQEIAFAVFAFDASDTAGFIERWGAALEAAPRAVSGEFVLAGRSGGRRAAQAMLVVDAGDPDTVLAALQPIAEIAPLVDQVVQLTTYDQVMTMLASEADHQGQGEPVSRSGLVDHLSAGFAREAAALLDAGAAHWFQVRSVGGAVADVPPEATAWAHRSANFSVVAMASRESELDPYWSRLYPFFDGLYLSFESGTRADALTDAFPPATLERLRGIKRRYDPDNVFRDNFNIAP